MHERQKLLNSPDQLQRFETGTQDFHNRAVRVILRLIHEINATGEQPDPSGWGVYGFDSAKVSPVQVTDIGPEAPDVEPDFEIHYFPSSADDEVQERRKGETITFISDKNPDVRFNIEFLPMNADKITFSEVTVPLPSNAVPKTNWHIEPSVVSVVKHDDDPYIYEGVVTQGIAPTQMTEGLEAASDLMAEADQILDGIDHGKYHMRIFGSSSNSPMKPKFILQQDRLKDGKK